MDLQTGFVIVHLFGVALGAGGGFMTDAIFLSSIKDYIFSNTEIRIIKLMSLMVWLGLILLITSGVGLFMLDVEKYLASDKFLLKMGIVFLLTLNGALFHFRLFPILKSMEGSETRTSEQFKRFRTLFIVTGAVSIVSWSAAIVLGTLRALPISLLLGASLYAGLILIGIGTGLLASRKYVIQN